MSTMSNSRGDSHEASKAEQRRPLSINTAVVSNSNGSGKQAWISNSSRSIQRLKQSVYCLVGLHFLLYSWVIFCSERVSTSYVSPELLGASRILWLIAHPDDESMFFAPSILNLLGTHPALNGTTISPVGHILSLSAGDADGLGATRTVEMRGACLAYGIQPGRCIVLDQERLPDNASTWWPEDVIERWVRTYVEKWSIDTIITFDETGVSSHANHRAICAAMTKAVNVDLQFPKVYTLRSARSVLSKYSGITLFPYIRLNHRWRLNHPLKKLLWDPDVYPIAKQKHEFLPSHPQFNPAQLRHGYTHPFSSFPTLLINSPWQYLQSRGAFKQHKSQVLWFRRLYMFFSRYLWVNELEKIVPVHLRIVDVGKVRQAQKDAL